MKEPAIGPTAPRMPGHCTYPSFPVSFLLVPSGSFRTDINMRIGRLYPR